VLISKLDSSSLNFKPNLNSIIITMTKNNFIASDIYLLHSIVSFSEKKADKILRSSFEISFYQFLIMSMVDEFPNCTQKFFANGVNLTEAAVSKLIQQNIESGTIKRKTDPKNRRQNLLSLTPKGLEVLSKSYNLLHSKAEEVFSPLTKNERVDFTKSLNKIFNHQNTQI